MRSGLDCFSGPSNPDAYACTTLCTGNELRFVDADDMTVGAVYLARAVVDFRPRRARALRYGTEQRALG